MADAWENEVGEKFFKSATTENGLTSVHHIEDQVFSWYSEDDTARLDGRFTPEELIGIARGMLLRKEHTQDGK